MSTAGSRRLFSPRKVIRVLDCRSNSRSEKQLDCSLSDYNDFLRVLRKIYLIRPLEIPVLVTTDRTVLDFDKFAELQDGNTLYLLHNEKQPLPAAVEEHIKYTPRHDMLIQSGIHEYYASEGKQPLPFALAELVDNALSATAKNTGIRSIEIRMLFDESLGKPAVVVLDNGCGMTSKQLKDWAVCKPSKLTRATLANQQEEYVRPDPVPRSLNSDMSYFGVGGKQAVFYIGDSVRMISKPAGSPDVHELFMSKEEFESQKKNREDVYKGIIKNREPGDSLHVVYSDDHSIHTVIAEERGKESFTAVVITGVRPEHMTYLKESFQEWTRDLAHTYHYYIHGVGGNDINSSHTNLDNHPKIDIQVIMQEKPPKLPRAINLREVDNDMQTLYINAAADAFEFKAATPDGGRVEGIIRYHPYLYDMETYPKDPCNVQAPPKEEDDENEVGARYQTRVMRQIFECFWNGRLIPYTTLSELDWCSWTKGSKVPEECYGRFSGVLFTNDKFRTNKLTFTDLEQKMKSRDTIFMRVLNGQEQGNVEKHFMQWLQNCHEKYDKQVKFLGFSGIITRNDVPTKEMQHPWATFKAIELDGRTYKRGQLVKSQKTQPILHGAIIQFLLYGHHDKDVFAAGGQVQISLEPKSLYNKTKIIQISKIDRTAPDKGITKTIENDMSGLPQVLQVDWPHGNPWPQNVFRPAGTTLGALKVQILNKKGEAMSRMPVADWRTVVKLSVKQTLVQHGLEKNEGGPGKDKQIFSLVAQHSASFWFTKIVKLTDPGRYTLHLSTIINETNDTEFAGRKLPSYKIQFNITAGRAEAFVMDEVSAALHVGVPFDIPLQLKDTYGNSATPPSGLNPVLECSDLALSYETVDICGKKLIIKGVKAKGKVLNHQQSKKYDLKVILPGLKKDTQTTKISLLPGNPHTLHVKREGNPFIIENGNPAMFDVEIHDEAGNVTAYSKQTVRCQIDGVPPVVIDCSCTGAGQIVSKPIDLKFTTGEPHMLRVLFQISNQKTVAAILEMLKVIPSKRVVQMKLYSQGVENLELKNNEKMEWLAGGSLRNLFYELYDEAGRKVLLTDETASKIKVSWTKPVNLKDVAQGKLPVVQVPTQVQDEQFYQVSYQQETVSVSFTIVPCPDDPANLKATELQKPVKLGETVSENLYLELVDQYNNPTKTLTSTCVNHINVQAEGLDKSAVTFKWQESSRSIQVAGIRFQSGTPGIREMRFQYCIYTASVIIKVTAGDPTMLKLVSGPHEPLQVVNDHSISTPFVVQLLDKWGNTSSDRRVVVELWSSPPALKVTTPVVSQPVNSEGKASFTIDGVSGPKGCYQLAFKGSFNNKPIPGPLVNLTVLPDPNKPVKLLVEYDTTARMCAGGVFPVFLVTVVSDEDIPMTTFNPAAVYMLLWEGEPSQQDATELRCSVPMENDRRDCFHFRNKVIPERAGKCTIQFCLRVSPTEVLLSDQIPVNVVANQPVKLGPTVQPPAPVVSCSTDVANRTLVNNLTLRIMDSYENPAGQDLDGRVVVSIASDDKNKSTPLFDGRLNRYHMNMVKGEVCIRRLSIMENSPGENGSQYTLLFSPKVPAIPTPLAPFKLTFHFYADALNQQKISGLLKKKIKLSASVDMLREVFNTQEELLKMLTTQYLTAVNKAVGIRDQLIQKNVEIPDSPSIAAIDALLTAKTNESKAVQEGQNRVCSIPDGFSGQQDVLGKVSHLAHVQDDAAARVVSWHIQGDMDCVITRNLETAQRIYKNTGGKQQVMALDTMSRSKVNRTLPHIRNGGPLFNPLGNPVYVREHLIFLQDKESCDFVFRNILGDTILIDDLDSGINYKREVVQRRVPCPTILTRQGDRISSMGKFGGSQNKAPSTNSFPVFGAPLPPRFYILQDQIELLRLYRAAVEKREVAENDRDAHLETIQSPDSKRKRESMTAMMEQLAEVERQLDWTSVRPEKRGAAEPHDIDRKRAR